MWIKTYVVPRRSFVRSSDQPPKMKNWGSLCIPFHDSGSFWVMSLEEVCSRYPRLQKVEEWQDYDIKSTINTLRNSIEVIKGEVHSESPWGKIRRWFTSLTLRAKEYTSTTQMLRSDEEGSALQRWERISSLDRVYTYSGWRQTRVSHLVTLWIMN